MLQSSAEPKVGGTTLGASRQHRILPAHVLGFGAALVALLYSVEILSFVASESHFINDDLYSDWLGRTIPFQDFVLSPIDVHVVWLHRVVTYVMNRLFPLDFSAAVGLLAAFHLLGVVVLGAALRRLVSPTVTAVLLAVYCTSPYVSSLFSWWTAGLHRLPYVLSMVTAVWAYLDFRRAPRVGPAAIVTAAMLFGLGFYGKSALLPLLLAGLDASLGRQDARSPVHRALLLAWLAGVAAAYACGWSSLVHTAHQSINWDWRFHAEFMAMSWRAFLSGFAGAFYDEPWTAQLLGGGAVALLALWTIHRARRNVLTWSLWAVLIATNFLVTALSKSRADAFGLLIPAVADRYYFELSFVTILFTAVALRNAGDEPPWLVRATPRGWLGAALGLASMALLANSASANVVERFYDRGTLQMYAREYFDRFTADLERLGRTHRGTLKFRNGQAPDFFGYGGQYRTSRGLLLISGADAKVVRRTRHRFRVRYDGSIVERRQGRR